MSQHRYRAFGLELVSCIKLPGLSAVPGGGAPQVAIEVVQPAAIEHAWSGEGDSPVWRGSANGRLVTGTRGRAGDVLLHCEDLGAYLLSADRGTLWCGALDPGGGEWRRFLLNTALVSTALLGGSLALHASAVSGTSGAIAFVSRGGGKTTIAAELVRRGHMLVADDVVVLGRTAAGAVVHPGPAVMNLPVEAFWSAGGVGRMLGLFDDEVWIEVGRQDANEVPLAALVLVEQTNGSSLTCHAEDASALDLLPHARGFNFEVGDGLRAFDQMSRLAANVPFFRLRGGSTHVGAELADAVERSLLCANSPVSRPRTAAPTHG